jgi:hypothetical protein
MSITHNNTHVNRPLSNLSIAFMSEDPSVADQVFPALDVPKQSDRYWIYSLADFNRNNVKTRAPASESAGATWSVSDDTYFCDPYALHTDIPWEIEGNEDEPLDADRDAVMFLTSQMKLNNDIQWAADYFTTGIWTGSTTGTDIVPGVKWGASNSTPIVDIRAQKRSMHTKTGRFPNTLVLGGIVWEALQDNSDFLDRLSGDERKFLTKDILARILEVDRVIIADMMKVTSEEGAASTTTSEIFGDRALLLHVAKRPGVRIPSAGYKFKWKVPRIGNQVVKKMDMPLKNATRMEIQTYYDNKVVAAQLGVLFDDVLA